MSRSSRRVRETKETLVEISLDIDSCCSVEVSTPIPFLNHLLTTMFFYMRSNAYVKAVDKLGYDDHHIVEDVAITLGDVLRDSLGDKVGIKRFAYSIVPMDDALTLVAVDISGRGNAYVKLDVRREFIGGLAIENIYHFLESLARKSEITLHVVQLSGYNSHHILESVFKGLGMVLYEATRVVSDSVMSVKGSL
jgi:imidazoleglycerol-phosphate dehydratase